MTASPVKKRISICRPLRKFERCASINNTPLEAIPSLTLASACPALSPPPPTQFHKPKLFHKVQNPQEQFVDGSAAHVGVREAEPGPLPRDEAVDGHRHRVDVRLPGVVALDIHLRSNETEGTRLQEQRNRSGKGAGDLKHNSSKRPDLRMDIGRHVCMYLVITPAVTSRRKGRTGFGHNFSGEEGSKGFGKIESGQSAAIRRSTWSLPKSGKWKA